METDTTIDRDDLRCEEKCVYEWVDCVDAEDNSSICRTRELNCFSECTI